MSGPIRPPLRVRDSDSVPNVIPVNTIVVSDGDLVDDGGATVTIDTSGAGGLPGTPAQSIQFNSDPAGTFTGSERLLFETGSNNAQIFIKSGASATQAEIRAVDGWGIQIGATDTDNSIRNQIVVFGENDATDGILLLGKTDGGNITLKPTGSGYVGVSNYTTDADSTLTVLGNAAGTPILNLKNDSIEVRLTCEEDDKLYVRGPTSGERFTFDASSATGGITWPDGTEQITAASGGGGFIPATPDGVTGPRFLLAPIGTMGPTDGQQPSVGYLYGCPFIAPKGDLSLTTDTSGGCSIRVVTAASSSSIIIGVYDADSGNNPQTLLATSTFDVSATGQQTNAWSDAVTLNEGEMYYVAWLRPSDETGAVEIRSWSGLEGEVPALGWRNAILLYNMVYDIENSPMTSMPATFGTPDGTNGALPSVGVVI